MVPLRTLLAVLSESSRHTPCAVPKMWCSTCQQDVPQLGSPSGDDARCAKCGTILHANGQTGVTNNLAGHRTSATVATKAETIALEKVLRLPPLAEEDWALE